MPKPAQATVWTLRYQDPVSLVWSAAKTFAAWGLALPRFRFVSQAPSQMAVLADGREVDATILFPFRSLVQVYKTVGGGSPVSYFVGVITRTPATGSKGGENQNYIADDPWWYLDQITYRQAWTLSLLGTGAVFGGIMVTPITGSPPNQSGGVIANFSATTPGMGYSKGQLIFFTDTTGGGQGAVGQVTTVDGSGGITGVSVLQGGRLYATPIAGQPSPVLPDTFLNPWVFTQTSPTTGTYLPQTTKWQIDDVFGFIGEYTDSAGPTVPIQGPPVNVLNSSPPGSISNNLTYPIPSQEILGITCGEVIRNELRFSPDAVTWFDYAATLGGNPRPQINFARQADMLANGSVLNYALGGGPGISALERIEINPRYDLERPVVQIVYRYNNQVTEGGQTSSWVTFYTDTYPTGVNPQTGKLWTGYEVSAVVAPVTLQGLDLSNVEAGLLTRPTSTAVVTTSPETDISGDTWWQSKIGSLKQMVSGSATLVSMVFSDQTGTPVGNTWADVTAYFAAQAGRPVSGIGSWTLLNELVSGQVASWMAESSHIPIAPNPGPVGAFEVYLDVVVNFAQANFVQGTDTPGGRNSGPVAMTGQQLFHLHFWLTSARLPDRAGVANQYYANASWAFPEEIYQGLARAVYQGCGADKSQGGIGTQYDGSLSFTEVECSGIARPGMLVNITGSANPAWASMNSPIQIVEEDLQSGRTTIAYGTPRHLAVQDIITLMSITRWRVAMTNPAVQNNGGQNPNQSNTTLGQQTAISDSTAAPTSLQSIGTLAVWPSGGGPLAAGQGTNLSTIPAPPVTTPPTTPHPHQGFGGGYGSALVLVQSGQPTPTSSNVAVPPNSMDPDTGFPVDMLAALADTIGSDLKYHSVSFQEVEICVDGKQMLMIVLCSNPYAIPT